MTDNLRLWESVSVTDPDYTKEYKGAGGFSGTAINSTYQIRKATQTFGPLGIGWGYSIIEDRIDDGHAIAGKDDSGKPFVHDNIVTKVHTLRLKLWYILDGQRGEVEHYGHTPFVFVNKFGVQLEPEAAKKSLTDAIGKCLSMLGFSADIFLGDYDDKNYVEQVRAELDIEKAEDREAEIESQRSELTEYITRHIESIKAAVTVSEVNGLARTSLRYLERRKAMRDMTEIATRGITAISREAESKKQTLEKEA